MTLLPDEFYPTPIHIANKMLENIDFTMIQSVLEPSAGDGVLVKLIANKMQMYCNSYGNRNEYKPDIDCIEINENLRYILKGNGYKIVHDDFLTYETYKHYNLIVMNPPFSNGEQHLLKALEMQKDGGSIVCLLNAETIRNPYSNQRKELTNKLNEYNATIDYITDAFSNAERKTDVEIALIKIWIPEAEKESYIYEQLRKEQNTTREYEQTEEYYQLIHNDFIMSGIDQYNFEVKAGIRLIQEYNSMKPLIVDDENNNDFSVKSILKLDFYNTDQYSNKLSINEFVRRVRMKYWKKLFDNPKFTGKLTQNLRDDYYKRLDELSDYDFSLFNIQTIRIEMQKNMCTGIEQTILDLFDQLSFGYSYYDGGKNIHYYNGWKTNKAWVINRKVIIPLNGFYWYDGSRPDYDYKVRNKLTDIEKVLNYLDCGRTESVDLEKSLKFAQEYGETKKIPLKYFDVTFYKKGTCHIEFNNDELLKKFNLFGSQRKGFLPPSYGKKKYSDMDKEEKTVIDEFEGEKSYNETLLKKDYYLSSFQNLPMLEQIS